MPFLQLNKRWGQSTVAEKSQNTISAAALRGDGGGKAERNQQRGRGPRWKAGCQPCGVPLHA